MADTRSTGTPGTSSDTNSAKPTHRPLFKAFAWLSDATIDASPRRPVIPHRGVLDLIAATQDVVRGVGLLLQVLETDSLCADEVDEHGDEVPPIFSPTNQSSLMRLAIVSLGMLDARAEEKLSCANWQSGADLAEGGAA